MNKCPKCGGPLQECQTLDQDDKVIKSVMQCKAKIPNMGKKGCGYKRTTAPKG